MIKNSPMNYLRHILALCTVLACLMVAPSAFAYQFMASDRCPNGATWSSNRQPLNYYINQNGVSTVPMTSLSRIIQDSFNAWSEPCCSGFSANYRGTTHLGSPNSNREMVLTFEENNWPAQMGNVNVTVAVTLFQASNDCSIYAAPILYNAVKFDFCTSGNNCTDLQSITTHEIGHSLGLNHSNHADATMYYAYTGGTSARTLSPDDIAGVCTLYPDNSCNCATDRDCDSGEVCNNGQCEKMRCTSDLMCPYGQACNVASGDCVQPTCAADYQCVDGFNCENNRCVSSCPTCRECRTHAECGSNAWCAMLTAGSNVGSCMNFCAQDGSCPGDSRCFRTPFALSSSGACNPGSCQPGEECVPDTDNGYTCVTKCNTNADCGTNQLCMDMGMKVCIETSLLCLNPDAAETGAICPDQYTCMPGSGGGTANSPEPVPAIIPGSAPPPPGTIPDAGPTPDIGEENNFGGDTGVTPDIGGERDADDALNDPNQIDAEFHELHGGCGCSSTPLQDEVPGSLMLLGAFGLGILWKRKR
ncbi:matrixin family metalloprotease [Bradymonas sediminis]|uniref:Uncharacterized protein n=1 Tax=Bradymonas sediminis TaxID=1548548 RepID=A0A2Z4FPA7_9DELT|nr:matrixin family metalloprotease [Bradymonas sediminis]AWV90484.1 hypothetical protein DN745_14560 [Bradymonas sediminis]TDP72127.1 matrixin [Bradymonas sediminis]